MMKVTMSGEGEKKSKIIMRDWEVKGKKKSQRNGTPQKKSQGGSGKEKK
jgi:hypothetical protein